MLRYLPLILAFVAVGGVAVYDGVLNSRWTPNHQAERFAQLLDEVPSEIGAWKSKDYEVNDDILRAAGAEGHISRAYVNDETGAVVKVWMIVGPFKHIVRHTPDICYPSKDFRASRPIELYSFPVDGIENQFRTTIFAKHSQGEQVFWSWLKPTPGEELHWYAAGERAVREEFAGTPALFKLYFTTGAETGDEDPAENVANAFAKEFLPVVNAMIARELNGDAQPAATPQS